MFVKNIMPHKVIQNQQVFCSVLGWMCGSSLKKVGQGVLELLIGNEKVTDGQSHLTTDLPTDRHVQSSMPSLLRRGA